MSSPSGPPIGPFPPKNPPPVNALEPAPGEPAWAIAEQNLPLPTTLESAIAEIKRLRMINVESQDEINRLKDKLAKD